MPRPLKENILSSVFMIFIFHFTFSQISGHVLYKFIYSIISPFVDVFLTTMSAVPRNLLANVPIFLSSLERSCEEALLCFTPRQ
jgi:hypothetical protein